MRCFGLYYGSYHGLHPYVHHGLATSTIEREGVLMPWAILILTIINIQISFATTNKIFILTGGHEDHVLRADQNADRLREEKSSRDLRCHQDCRQD